MSDLTDFLLARIAEDEAEASCWAALRVHPDTHLPAYQSVQARVLAECDAKRRIIAAYPAERRYIEDWELGKVEPRVVDAGWQYPAALYLLALPYADHPDHREEWRV